MLKRLWFGIHWVLVEKHYKQGLQDGLQLGQKLKSKERI